MSPSNENGRLILSRHRRLGLHECVVIEFRVLTDALGRFFFTRKNGRMMFRQRLRIGLNVCVALTEALGRFFFTRKMVGWCLGRIDVFDVNVCVALEFSSFTEAFDLVKS